MGKYLGIFLAVGAGLATVLAFIEVQKSAELSQNEYFKAYHDHHRNFDLESKYGDDFHIV